jgi:NADH-quinone oxidoreductase subunit N
MGAIAMDWTLALPELVLALCGMGILVFGVLQKHEAFRLCSMLVVGAFLLTAILVITGGNGVGYSGLFTEDGFARFIKLLVLVAASLGVIVSLDYNEHENLKRFEFPVLMPAA